MTIQASTFEAHGYPRAPEVSGSLQFSQIGVGEVMVLLGPHCHVRGDLYPYRHPQVERCYSFHAIVTIL